MAAYYRFTKKDYDDMERRRNAGETLATIALTYGCTGQTIRNGVINRPLYTRRCRSWRNEVMSRESGVTTIALYRNSEHMGDMLIDTARENDILSHNWRLNSGGYAVTSIAPTSVPVELHRLYFAAPEGLVCDHINRNKLDNRRCNLRHVSQSVNLTNTARNDIVRARPKRVSRWGKGCIYRKGKLFTATLRNVYLGLFKTKREAQAAIKSGKRVVKRILRPRGSGSVNPQSKGYEARLNGFYLGYFKTTADAEAAIKRAKNNE